MVRIKNILFSFFILNSVWGLSQTIQREALYSSGGFGSVGTVSVQSNIGEFMASTFINSQNYLSQGFVQPKQSLISLVNEMNEEVTAKAFPNPVTNNLSVELSGIIDLNNVVINVYDIIGRRQDFEITKQLYDSNGSVFDLDLKNLSTGSYFIKIIDLQKGFSTTIKINKL